MEKLKKSYVEKRYKEKAEISYEQGVENAKNFSSDASIEALMAMGGTLVE